jgi:hypothetical protein
VGALTQRKDVIECELIGQMVMNFSFYLLDCALFDITDKMVKVCSILPPADELKFFLFINLLLIYGICLRGDNF